MTCSEMLPAIGARVALSCDGLRVACTVEDVKTAWGRPRFLVRPVAGSGEVWVELSRITAVSTGAVTVSRAVQDRRGALSGGWMVTAGCMSHWFADSEYTDSKAEAELCAAEERRRLQSEAAWSTLSPDERDRWRRKFNRLDDDSQYSTVADFYLRSIESAAK